MLPLQSWLARGSLCSAFLVLGCASGPPLEIGDFREADLVELTTLDATIRLDVRYATSRNFLGRPVYTQARAFLQRPAAEALARVQRAIAKEGLGLCVFDGYRPWRVTKVFWDETPADKHDFVANPQKGSKHNRGCAVDLTLVDLKTGQPLEMPSEYDEFSERAHPNYAGGPEEPRKRREQLRSAMEREGFAVYEFEWWHFDYRDWQKYRVLDVDFAEMAKGR